MSEVPALARPADERARAALRHGLETLRPGLALDRNGYAATVMGNLVSAVDVADFETDLRDGDGGELEGKFRAAHSSSALAVNCFAPFKRDLAALTLCGRSGFTALRFERRCPTGLRGGRAPNLDALLDSPDLVVGIESKLTEPLAAHRAAFSPAYREQLHARLGELAWFREMLRLMEQPTAYAALDAAQLVKHAFGLANVFVGRRSLLLYLFWEPTNPGADAVFARHRAEIADFAERVAGGGPAFAAMSYAELWAEWQRSPTRPWLMAHLGDLGRRYAVAI